MTYMEMKNPGGRPRTFPAEVMVTVSVRLPASVAAKIPASRTAWLREVITKALEKV